MKLLEFTATWCAPCKALAPTLRKLHKTRPDIVIDVIDVDTVDGGKLADKRNVQGVPTIIAVDPDGREVARLLGAITEKTIIRFWEKIQKGAEL